MIEDSGSGSIPLTNGSGSRRPKNMWIRLIRIRIRNSGSTTPACSSMNVHSFYCAGKTVWRETWLKNNVRYSSGLTYFIHCGFEKFSRWNFLCWLGPQTSREKHFWRSQSSPASISRRRRIRTFRISAPTCRPSSSTRYSPASCLAVSSQDSWVGLIDYGRLGAAGLRPDRILTSTSELHEKSMSKNTF